MGGLFGASDPGGVKLRPLDYEEFGLRRTARIITDKAEGFHALLWGENGKPFDGDALWAFFGEERNWRLPLKWFCSELVCHCLEQAGFFPYELLVPKNRVSPADLLLLLNPWINAEEFR